MHGLERIFYEVLADPACNETFASLDAAGLDVVFAYYEMFQVKNAYDTAIELEKADHIKNSQKKANKK